MKPGKNIDTKVKPEDRNIVLDVAKGILILLMVIGHASPPSWLENAIYSFHMPCFFIISGILFSYSYLNRPGSFIKRRIKTIWWPFVKWTWIFLVLHNLFENIGIYDTHYSLVDIFYKFIKIFFLLEVEQLLGGFWFLRALFIASIFCLFYYKIFGTSRISLFSGILFLVFSAEMISVFKFRFLYLEESNFLACGYFMAGTLFQDFKIKNTKAKKVMIISSMLLIALFAMGNKIEILNLTAENLIPYFLLSVIISYSFLFILESLPYKSWTKYISYFGMKTIDILIIHFLAFRIVSLIKIKVYDLPIEALKKFPVISENNTIFWIVYVILGLIICMSFSSIKEYIHGLYSLWKANNGKKEPT